MFTGYINEIGVVQEPDGEGRVCILAPKASSLLDIGGSFAIAGCCISAEKIEDGVLHASLSEETQRRSTLSELTPGDRVNVELPLRLGDPLEGHVVQGHIDAIAKVMRVDDERMGRRVWLRPPERVLGDLVPKGSVTVDGVSLTVAEVVRDRFSVALVPSTLERTTLGMLEPGRRVNLETDLVGKLAGRHASAVDRAMQRFVAPLPWSGVVTGALGIEKVVAQISSGGAVMVWDPDREAEADIIIGGACMTPAHFTFILTQACCHPTVPCAGEVLERLEIPPMPGAGDHHGTWMYTSVDLAAERGTGVSAAQRAATVRKLADPESVPEDFVSPGHVFPLRARAGGLREREGHTEATVALCRAAGLPPVGVCCEVMNRDGTMAGSAEAERLAVEWGVPLVEVGELVTRL